MPHARVLAESLLEHHPNGRFTTLVIDLGPDERASESFDILSPYEIGLESREVHRMAMIYDLKEFATAVKPFLLKSLLSDSSDIVYMDPDIEVFAPLGDISELTRRHSIVLTPHTRAPVPRDGLVPDEQMILRAGIYNLGFIGVGTRAAASFLEWWSERLSRDCRVAVEEELFVDQRWVDLVPVLFDHFVLDDPTINVAYWNLHERAVRWTGQRYEVDGRPLRLFHFSGYDPRFPDRLSVHAGRMPRTRFSDYPDLERLCDEYAARLFRHGFETRDGWSYRFDRLPNGRLVDRQMRTLFRQALLAAEAGEAPDPPPDPFDPASADVFQDWLEERHRGRRTWLGALARGARSGIRPRQGRPLDQPGAESSAHTASSELAPRRSRGVNVIGYLEAELGLGEIARKLVAATERAGIPTSTITCRGTIHRQEYRFHERGAGALYDTNIICINADKLPKLHAELGVTQFAGRYSIGVWFWEIAHFPATMHPALDLVDELWVASDFVRESISAATRKPVLVVPIPLEPQPPALLSREDIDLPEGFLYLFSFDYFSIFERKNPIGVVEAFKRAFAPGAGPSLLIRSINGDHHTTAREILNGSAVGRADIRIVDGYVSPAERDALMAACDCYVSLHRSEGLGLTMAEAMAFGKPVIATGYSGNLTFMDERNSYLVRYGMTTVPRNCDPYTPGVEWADPDLDHAAELMRHVYDHPQEAHSVGQQASRDLRERHSLDRTAQFVAERLQQIPEAARTLLAVRGALDHAAEIAGLAPGDSLERVRRRTPAGRFLRGLLRRALWPELAEQRRLDSALVESMRRLIDVYGAELDRLNALSADSRNQNQRIQELEQSADDVARPPDGG